MVDGFGWDSNDPKRIREPGWFAGLSLEYCHD